VRTELPGAPDTADRIVCHVDMDCFYAACERLREPPLRGEPVVVGMGYEPDEAVGAVATASYEAREFGVESAQAISEALERLPRKADAEADPELSVAEAGYYRPVDLDFYEAISGDVMDLLRKRADVLREVSIDEAYLDVTDRTDWEGVHSYVERLRADSASEVGVTASVGVAPTMSAAKVASDHDKPDGLVVVDPGEVRSFLAPLAVERVHGVGPVTGSELREMGVETAGDLAGADPATLADRFGERGRRIHRFARGEDDRAVEPTGNPKSLSRESAFSEATEDDDRKRERVRTLARDVADRARRRNVLYGTIGIKVVTPPFDVHTRARSLSGPVSDADVLERVALELLAEFDGVRVRKLGVRVSNLSFAAGDQPTLEAWSGEERGNQAGAKMGGNEEGNDEEGDDEDERGWGDDRTRDRGIIRSGQLTLADFE